MPPARRLLALATGVFAVWLALAPPARGTAEPTAPGAAPHPAAVRLTFHDGPPVEGTLDLTQIRIRASYGELAVDVPHVETLHLEPGDDPGTVLVYAEMSDHSRVSGPLLTAEFPLTVNGERRTVPAADVREVKFLHPPNPSLTAAVIGLITLTAMEIVLGVDNVIFLAIVAGKLPRERQRQARRIGLLAALGTRLLLLATLSVLLGLTRPIVTLPELPFLQGPEARGLSWRDIILLVGGAFLIGKSVFEMHEKLDRAADHAAGKPAKVASFATVIVQIAIIDIIFSLDSVITAVGMVEQLWVMVTAMLIAVGVMLVAAEPIARFVDHHPTVKILALSFLILIGVLLVAEGLGQHLNKGYIYFAMAFAVAVEFVNLRLRGHSPAVPPEMPAAAPAT